MRQEGIDSKNNIIKAFIKLLKVKPFDKVSIKEICDNANVSRQTFYAHYASKDDIFKKFYIEMFNELCLKKITDVKYFYSDGFIWSVIDFFEEWNELFIVLNQWDLLTYLTKESTNAINDIIREICDIPYITDHPSYFLSFVYEPLTSICLKWVLSGKKETKNELLKIIVYYRNTMNGKF